MSREKQLVKNTAIISIGTFFPKIVSMLLTPILTAELTAAEFGQYDLIITISSLLLPIATLQISSAAFRFLIEVRDSKEKSCSIISTIISFVVIVSAFVCALFRTLIGEQFGSLGSFVVIYLFINSLLITIQQIARGLGYNLFYSISAMIFSAMDTIFIALLLLCFRFQNGLLAVLFSMSLASLLSLLFLVFKGEIYRYYRIRGTSISQLKKLLSYSWPMIPNNLSDWVLRLSDRMVITAFLGIEANAMYAVANKLPTIFTSFQTTFSLAWQENASIVSKDSDRDDYYTKMCDFIFKLLIGVMAMLIMCTPLIWKLLIRGSYEEAYYQLPVLYIAMMFSCMASTIAGIYIAHMKTRNVGLSTMAAAILNLLIDLLLINKIGIWAGSISTLISYLVLLIYRIVNVQKFQKIYFHKYQLVFGVLFLTVMACLNYLNNIYCFFINILIGGLIITIYDREVFAQVIRVIVGKVKKRIK